MPIIRVEKWRPDAAEFNAPGTIRAANVYPGLNSYEPVGDFAAATDALDARPRGAITVQSADGNVRQYAGSATYLYENISGTWTDRSQSGNYSTDTEEAWELVPWKNKLLATNFTDTPQQIQLGAANFTDLTTDFRARHMAAVGNFVIAANTFDVTDDAVGDRVRNSAFNNENDWTISSSTGANYRDLGKGGPVMRVIGGEIGLIISQSSIFRVSFVGYPTWLQFDETLPGIGTIASGSVAQYGDLIFLWSEQGLLAVTGGGTSIVPIGAGKFDNYIRNDLDLTNRHRISSAIDPTSRRFFLAYPGSGNTNGRPNKLLVYDMTYNEASIIEYETEFVWRAGGVAYSADAVDALIPNPDASSDSPDALQWKSGAPQLSIFDSSFISGTLTGSPMAAQIDTQEIELTPGRKTRLTGFRPVVDGGTVAAKVGTRDRQTDAYAFGSSLSQRATGRFATRTNARYHRFRLDLSGAWTNAIGVDIDPRETVTGSPR